MHYVYVHRKATDLLPFYVGCGRKYRARDCSNRTMKWKDTVEKHGLMVEVVAKFSDRSQALAQESKLIDAYRVYNIINTKYDENIGRKQSRSERKMRSLALKEACNRPESKLRYSEAAKKRWADPIHREKQRLAIVNAMAKESYKQNHRAAMNDPEVKRKNAELHKGRTPWNKGKKLSDETRLKLSLSHMGQKAWNKGLKKEDYTKLKNTK